MSSNEPKYEKDERVFFKEDKSGANPYRVEGVGDNGVGNSYDKRWEIMIRDSNGKQQLVAPSAIRRASKRERNALEGSATQRRNPRDSPELTTALYPSFVPQGSAQEAHTHLPETEMHTGARSAQTTPTPIEQNIESPQPTVHDVYKGIRQVLRQIKDLPETITQGFNVALDHRDQELELRSHINDLIEQFSFDFAAKAGVPPPDPADGSDPSKQALDNLKRLRTMALNYVIEQDIQRKALNRSIQSLQADANALHARELQWTSEHRTLTAQCEQLNQERTESEERFRGLEQQTRSKQQREQQEIGEGLTAFWESREKFYRGLHRGILAEKEGDERRRLRNRRGEILKADIALLERLGCQMSLVPEALSFSRASYDGSLHHWHEDRDDPVPNGEPATVFLPGWRIDDTEFKPSFGGQEIVE